MKAHKFKDNLPEKFVKLDKLKSLLIRGGNKERTTSFLLSLFYLLKQCLRAKDYQNNSISFAAKNPLNILPEKNPFKVLDKCLYELMPAFILKRTFVAGKFYNLPVPVSQNRSVFMAADWLRKAAFQSTKTPLTVPHLITREIGAVFHKTGSARLSLNSYIDIALDQRPFSRYIRKKRKIVSRSKRGVSFIRLKNQFRRSKKRIKKAKYRAINKKYRRLKRNNKK